jgi:DNA primase
MPVVFEEKVVGWQRRTFLPEKHFWSSPGIKNYFYCSSESMLYKTIILCEGPGDVWAIGDEALGLFGKTISVHQLNLLKTKYANAQKIVVLLDGDAVEDAYKLAYTIKSSMPEKEIIVAELPPDRDPGDLSREEIIKWIKLSQKKI